MTRLAGLTADEFHRQRDLRTGLVVRSSAYREASVRITLGRGASSFADQVAFLTAVNLTVRWCPTITLSTPAVAVDPRLSAGLGLAKKSVLEAATALARAADPFAEVCTDGASAAPTIHLAVGSDVPPGAYPVLGRGWLGMAGDAVREGGDTENPLGALLAACIGVAYLFRTAVGAPWPARGLCLSVWNLQGGEAARDGPALTCASLGRVLLIGCGAVGSAIVYVLPLTGLTAEFELVDGDRVEISNLGTAPLFFADRLGDFKTDIAAEHLRRNDLTAVGHPYWFDQAVASGRIFVTRPDIVIPAANERGVRWHIQHQVPPLQIYATTGRSWDAFLGRHIPLQEDCLACRFPRPQRIEEPRLACGQGNLPTPREPETFVTATLPFLPTAAAVMAVAELAKLVLPGYPRNANFACLDFLGSLGDFLVVPHAPRHGCICEGQVDVWAPLNAATKFARLSA